MNGIRILVLNDDEASRYALAHPLQVKGYRVFEAGTIGEAIQLLKEQTFHVAILDVKLPDGNGTDLCRYIKNDALLAQTLVLQVSASLISLADRVAALECGADAFLVMPIDSTELVAQVRALLRMREAELAREETEKERKLAEDALKESNHRLQQAMQTAGMFAFEWEVATDHVTRSEESGKILGLEGDAVKHDTAAEYFQKVHPEDRERFVQIVLGLSPESSHYTACYRVIRPNGSIVVLEERGSGSFKGRELCRVIGMAVDVTERVRAEQQLKESQESLRLAHQRLMFHMENSPLGVIEFDPELRLTYWSRGAVNMFGWEAAEVLGKCMWEIPWIPEEDVEKVKTLSASMISGIKERTVSPNRNLRKGGGIIWCEWHNSSLTDSSGKVQSILSLVTDVTEQKEFESKLEKAVTERTRELREMNDQLNAFCYSIAHDLKAPLRAQAAFATILEQDFGEQLGETGRSYARRINEAAERQSKLVSDLLSHMGLSRAELPILAVDLAPILRQVRTDLVLDIGQKQAVLELGALDYYVLGNPASLHLVLQNLLSNALKFVVPGVVPRVKIWAEAVEKAEWSPCKRLLRCWVEDNGIGIPPQFQGKLFGVFQRLHAAQNYPGTGMGLAIVKKAIERMGGEVGVESEPGRGSRFWFELPLASPEPELKPDGDVKPSVDVQAIAPYLFPLSD